MTQSDCSALVTALTHLIERFDVQLDDTTKPVRRLVNLSVNLTRPPSPAYSFPGVAGGGGEYNLERNPWHKKP